jgi:hypothetical protein
MSKEELNAINKIGLAESIPALGNSFMFIFILSKTI